MAAELFIDTSFLIAAVSSRDRNHQAAAELSGFLSDSGGLTTNHVLGETWTFARRRFGHGPALKLVDAVQRGSRYRVVRVDRKQERSAWQWLRGRDEREYSFVDATSFAVMWQRGITEALAFDRDFEAAGFGTPRR